MAPMSRSGGRPPAAFPRAVPGHATGVGRRPQALLGALLLAAGLSHAVRADEPREHWEAGEARWFLASRADLGTVEHVGVSAGWGKPHWLWGGVEAHGLAGLDFGAVAANLRISLLIVDLWGGLRTTRAWRHVPLPDVAHHDGLPAGGGSTYHTLDLFGSGVVPTPGGLALWEVNAVRFLDPPAGVQIYEEWLRVVCAPPWCGVARLAWAARLREGALHVGAGAEWAFVDGRSGTNLVRLGPMLSWRIWPHIALQGYLYFPVSDPDQLAFLDRVNALLVLGFTFATGDPPPRFP